MSRIFGTDGIRGIANGDLSIELAMDIGRAAGMVVEETIGRQPIFLVGSDTRISADMLESAMAAGLCSAGANVIILGVVPTPAVAYLVKHYHADAGVMLSASHNPYEYNGIKIFNGNGYKLLDHQEEEIEEIVLDHSKPYSIKAPQDLGCIRRAENPVEAYVEYLSGTVKTRPAGMRIAVDCANGSASVSAKLLFERLGVEADIFHADPDGCNINNGCGSTHIAWLSETVKQGGYDGGLAFDGDADRCLAVDEKGQIIDGDHLLAFFAYWLKSQGKLKNNTVVATVMSNLGFFKFGEEHSIDTRAAKVGDRYVLETMRGEDFVIGGEQSGHIIFLEHMTTGDGQLSGIQLLSFLKEAGMTFSQARNLMRQYPQTLLNIEATPEMKQALEEDSRVQGCIDRLGGSLGGDGRILVRPSGTEPLIRIMVEGKVLKEIEAIAKEIASVIMDCGAKSVACGAGV